MSENISSSLGTRPSLIFNKKANSGGLSSHTYVGNGTSQTIPSSIWGATALHEPRQTDEQIIEQILEVKASKAEILEALREMFPEKFL